MRLLFFFLSLTGTLFLIGCGGNGVKTEPQQWAGQYATGGIYVNAPASTGAVKPMGGGPYVEIGSITVTSDGRFDATVGYWPNNGSKIAGTMTGKVSTGIDISIMFNGGGEMDVTGSTYTYTPQVAGAIKPMGGGANLASTVTVTYYPHGKNATGGGEPTKLVYPNSYFALWR